MRRSKSDPSKYTRNYRKISQRRMTADDDTCHDGGKSEEKEIERLRQMLRTSQAHLDRAAAASAAGTDQGGGLTAAINKASSKKRNRIKIDKQHQRKSEGGREGEDDDDDKKAVTAATNSSTVESDPPIFSPEMQAEMAALGEDPNAVVLPSRRKKNKSPKKAVELSPEEIRAARAQHKNASRKLKQLADRAEQKRRRAELYATLRENAISAEERSLLCSSSTLGKRVSKKEQLQKLLKKERAGIQLAEEERSLLYTDRGQVGTAHQDEDGEEQEQEADGNSNVDRKRNRGLNEEEVRGPDQVNPSQDEVASKRKKKRKKNKKGAVEAGQAVEPGIVEAKSNYEMEDDDANSPLEAEIAPGDTENGEQNDNRAAISKRDGDALTASKDGGSSSRAAKVSQVQLAFDPASFAAQMMAGISSLKTSADADAEELRKKELAEAEAAESDRLRKEEEERKNRKAYVPTESIVLKSAASLGIKSTRNEKSNWRVLSVNRPEEIERSRYDLPVSAMEFEIVDAVRSSDTTIICAETGSGKSTQVVTMLYEAGLTLGNAKSISEDEGLLIGVTQPRRVAAVSTAKRVCYEMGHSQDQGQSIRGGKKGEGNLVAYQTRYESAGLGSANRVKFMTDGILLKEIQSDLLLRKYSAIILDEAHERNLNTDVLLGLLSKAIPLRRKAAADGSMPPLKLIIMSATLRVEDFAGNDRLFPESSPKLVRVPGRTHPVTIHHNKVTELDNYTDAAYKKVCQIHRKLPTGGILLFLTSKQEIIKMVNRLRKGLAPRHIKEREVLCDADVSTLAGCKEGEVDIENIDAGAIRDMDDDEVDGDIFEGGDQEEFDDHFVESDDDNIMELAQTRAVESNDRPEKVLVLPLYSLLSSQEQAKVFCPVPEGTRLIVCATNIAETSLTIPNISYVVDTGRQKCLNYHAGTGVTSYDVMWISKAAADQRAGRAGRTSEGHCYRLYSSSLYSRHMDPFALPEVLTRPLEDVALAMKAMNITNVASFPFPTPPDPGQSNAAIKLLARIGCIDMSRIEELGGDGKITRLGAAIAKLPLGVRYGKMLLVAAQANVLDYGIIMVAVLSESSPFVNQADEKPTDNEKDNAANTKREELKGCDDVDRNQILREERKKQKEKKRKWTHRGGDVLASILAVGAYTYAGRGAGGAAEIAACKTFCEENGLNYVIMERIQKMRKHLAKLAKTRLGSADGVAAKTGRILVSMPPPNKLQEKLLIQAVTSGLLDNIARRSPPGAVMDDGPRTRYYSCSSKLTEPLFIDQNSVLYSKDFRKLPEWVCYDTCQRKTTKDGSTISVMKNVTPIDPEWLGSLSDGSNLLSMGAPLETPLPAYDKEKDAVMCSVITKFGDQGWLIPPRQITMYEAVNSPGAKGSAFLADDSFRWFARFLLEGKVLVELKDLSSLLNDDPAIISRRKPVQKVALLVSNLASAGIDSAAALRKHWAEKDSKFLFKLMKSWAQKDRTGEVKKLWISAVKANVKKWREDNS